ncbi:MBL fold metallo-hydrolase [Methanomassiliicoccaceae archaeon COG_1]|nr:MBL fold metallo-hydrolase [Methanomassiliicoccaceae archaeon COG_1]
MSAELTDIYDDGALPNTGFIGADGFSVVIDVDGERTLFGAGRRVRYMQHNMSDAEVEADSLTRLVVPCGTADCAGAVDAVLRDRCGKLPILAPAEAWGARSRLSRSGISPGPEYADRFERSDVSGWVGLSPRLLLTPSIGGEVFAVVLCRRGPVIVGARCACGPAEVISEVRSHLDSAPIGYVGGILSGRGDALADAAAEAIKDMDFLYLNHCTGERGINRIRRRLGLGAVNDLYAGQRIALPDRVSGSAGSEIQNEKAGGLGVSRARPRHRSVSPSRTPSRPSSSGRTSPRSPPPDFPSGSGKTACYFPILRCSRVLLIFPFTNEMYAIIIYSLRV